MYQWTKRQKILAYAEFTFWWVEIDSRWLKIFTVSDGSSAVQKNKVKVDGLKCCGKSDCSFQKDYEGRLSG